VFIYDNSSYFFVTKVELGNTTAWSDGVVVKSKSKTDRLSFNASIALENQQATHNQRRSYVK
jgi:hypothetical protein